MKHRGPRGPWKFNLLLKRAVVFVQFQALIKFQAKVLKSLPAELPLLQNVTACNDCMVQLRKKETLLFHLTAKYFSVGLSGKLLEQTGCTVLQVSC